MQELKLDISFLHLFKCLLIKTYFLLIKFMRSNHKLFSWNVSHKYEDIVWHMR